MGHVDRRTAYGLRSVGSLCICPTRKLGTYCGSLSSQPIPMPTFLCSPAALSHPVPGWVRPVPCPGLPKTLFATLSPQPSSSNIPPKLFISWFPHPLSPFPSTSIFRNNSLLGLNSFCSKYLECFISKFVVVQSLSHTRLFVTPWAVVCQASLSFTVSWSLLSFMSTESVMPSNHLILCCSIISPSIFPSIRVFYNELPLHIRWPEYWSFSISPSSEYSDLVSFRIDFVVVCRIFN